MKNPNEFALINSMTTEPQRHILLYVAGMTPQIITETLYAITQQRGERVDEIRVITTLAGRDKLLSMLLDKESGEFFKFCRDYEIDSSSIKFDETTIALLRTIDGRTLEDIRTPKENELAGDQICEIVRELTHDPTTRIHASAAGGRKTMSIYLTAAMQLFGRAHDTLSHVLVRQEFETNREFFYPPPVPRELTLRDGRTVSTADAEIYLADVPFIRLRGLNNETLHKSGASLYGELVGSAQEALDVRESEYELHVDMRRDKIVINNQTIKLSPREMFFYTMFAKRRANPIDNETNGTFALTDLKVRDLAATFEVIMRARGESLEWASATTYPQYDFLTKMIELIKSKDGESLMELKNELRIIIARIKKKIMEHGCDERYAITLRNERGSNQYGIAIASARIVFNE